MKALVFQAPGKKALEERPKPTLKDPGDAIVRVTKTTICGTDLHILKGDVEHLPTRRCGIDLLYLLVRTMSPVPGWHVFSLRERRLDSGQCY